MMTRSLAVSVFAFAAISLSVGCGGSSGNGDSSPKNVTDNPSLVGEWYRDANLPDGTGGTLYQTKTIALKANGSFIMTYTGEQNCEGAETYTGGTWSATTTTLTTAGTGTCEGSFRCLVAGIAGTTACSGTTSDMSGSSSYALSNGDKTLTLTYSDNSTYTYTRR